jgi:tetratricopeptide (TPR) repeat protein
MTIGKGDGKMAAVEEIDALYNQARYRELIELVKEEDLHLQHEEDARKLLRKGWAYHQLGEYDESIPIMRTLHNVYPATEEIGESATRGLAHGILQRDGAVEEADSILRDNLPPGLACDNVRMNTMIMAARKGMEIPASEVMDMITNALLKVPYATVNGHIINNGALTLHEARQQEGVKFYLPILPALMSSAIGIYRATNTAKNHLAGATFRNSQICEAAGWKKIARIEAEASVELWLELVNSQDGARYRRNLEGAEAQLKRLT